MTESAPPPREAMRGTPTRDESEAERLDRNLGELLQELRVIVVGVQVVFAFLLSVAFSQGRAQLTGVDKGLYLAVLISTAAGAACLVAPAAHHRLVFRQGRKAQLIALANVLTTTGMALVATSISGSLALVSDVIYGRGAGIVVGLGAAAMFAGLWFVAPVVLLRRPLGIGGSARRRTP